MDASLDKEVEEINQLKDKQIDIDFLNCMNN
jgi:hypothetical protein